MYLYSIKVQKALPIVENKIELGCQENIDIHDRLQKSYILLT